MLGCIVEELLVRLITRCFFLSRSISLGSLVSLPQENADQPDRVPEWEERAAVHGGTLGAIAERTGQ